MRSRVVAKEYTLLSSRLRKFTFIIPIRLNSRCWSSLLTVVVATLLSDVSRWVENRELVIINLVTDCLVGREFTVPVNLWKDGLWVFAMRELTDFFISIVIEVYYMGTGTSNRKPIQESKRSQRSNFLQGFLVVQIFREVVRLPLSMYQNWFARYIAFP